MKVFEIGVFTAIIRHEDGRVERQDDLSYMLPDSAAEAVDPILNRYGQESEWFFDRLNYGRGPAPWAFACLDREYDIAGHLAEARHPEADILFSPYQPTAPPFPVDFVPKVGVLVIQSWSGLARVAHRSPVFGVVWRALADRRDATWLAVLDPLDSTLVERLEVNNHERWLLRPH